MSAILFLKNFQTLDKNVKFTTALAGECPEKNGI